MTMRGSKGNKKGFSFQKQLSENICRMYDYESGEVDENLYCESINDTSRDKVDNYVKRLSTGKTKFISAKCPGNEGAFQMSSFTVDRQLKFLEHKVGFVPQVLQDFCYAYFGNADYKTWMSANVSCGVDITDLCPKEELRRQRTLATNISTDVKDGVLQYLNRRDVREAFVQMHLISGFTDRAADYQIYHPAKTKEDIDFSSDNFYAINLEMLKSSCTNWKWNIGASTTNFGPLNWKVRGGGGASCTPTKGSYHNAQCFSGVANLKRAIGSTDAFFKGTLPQVLQHVYREQ
jgi:hypothetical protein